MTMATLVVTRLGYPCHLGVPVVTITSVLRRDQLGDDLTRIARTVPRPTAAPG